MGRPIDAGDRAEQEHAFASVQEASLAGFLLARIAEDEAVALRWPEDDPGGLAPDGHPWRDPHGQFVYMPRERALAECAAKRGIVEVCSYWGEGIDPPLADEARILHLLASLCRDHPDYRDEWKP